MSWLRWFVLSDKDAQEDNGFVRQESWISALLFLIFWGSYCLRVWQQRWISDDGLINIRVTRHLLYGYGPVFNIGERVEAYTSPLWIAVLGFLGWFGLSPTDVAVYLGGILACLGVCVGYFACVYAYKEQGQTTLWLPLGMIVFVALPPFWDFATSGLESGLMLMWMATSYAFLVHLRTLQDEQRTFIYFIGLWLSFGPLIRPDCAIFSLLYGASLCLFAFRDEKTQHRWSFLFIFSVCLGFLPISYQVFRMGYFAALVPNTAIAKEAFSSNWQQGGYFFLNFFQLYVMWIPLVLVLLIKIEWYPEQHKKQKHQEANMLLFLPSLIGLLHFLYVLKVGGGFMHGRLFLGPIFCFLLPLFAIPLQKEHESPLFSYWFDLSFVFLVIWALCIVIFVRVEKENQHGIGDERGWYARKAGVTHPTDISDYKRHFFYTDAKRVKKVWSRYRHKQKNNSLKLIFSEKKTYKYLHISPSLLPLRTKYVHPKIKLMYMKGAMGIIGVYWDSQVHLVDTLGLASPLASRMKLTKRGRPGHEKNMHEIWMLARFAKPHKRDRKDVKEARNAIYCPGSSIKVLVDAVTKPLTINRFFSNIALSFSLTSLRIEPNPKKAYAQLCRRADPKPLTARSGPLAK